MTDTQTCRGRLLTGDAHASAVTPDPASLGPSAATLDAGEENCATLILNVRAALAPLRPGEVLEVVAYDPSAQLDLRAWSRMTGHGYLGMLDHGSYAVYYLRKRGA